ncbi:AAA family ATPase [Paenisporosarcina cavernae]|uniref:MoxR family ATPase n=1 Tax=Paenisporosarcina cavernae TaxID=2320858 RepID=A0A385YR58_9BACL|nr:MoxR family ATPase [Paenisporosarcina cavernae]AYC29066.1 MoxR family ATPase [Paenisporosarcina cavernae]
MNTLQTFQHHLKQTIVGREKEFDLMTIALLQGGHVLLESVPGSGKTMMAKSFAAAFEGAFRRVQFTPDVLPSDVTGIHYFDPKSQSFVLRPGPVMSNILLADEINRATPRTQSSLLESMEEKQVTIDGETLKLPKPFMVLATQNPVESQQGTFPLPAAQLDRFMFRIGMNYPTFSEEVEIVRSFRIKPEENHVQSIVSQEEVQKWQEDVQKVEVHEDIETYVVKLVQETRQNPYIELGLSSRAAIALILAAQGAAFLHERNFVTPDDVKFVFPYLATHRILLTAEGMLLHTPEAIIQAILETVDAPVEASIS